MLFRADTQAAIHRQPLSVVMLYLRLTLENSANFEGVMPLFEDWLDGVDYAYNAEKMFENLHSMGLLTEASDYGELTAVGRLVGELGVDINVGKMMAYGIALGVGLEAAVMAAALCLPRGVFRLASQSVHTDPDEFNYIVQQVGGWMNGRVVACVCCDVSHVIFRVRGCYIVDGGVCGVISVESAISCVLDVLFQLPSAG